ncbi:hypothetical protein [Methyloferula stellata]|nr:hypothetical protein [Methyloferula stellata]
MASATAVMTEAEAAAAIDSAAQFIDRVVVLLAPDPSIDPG